MQHNTLPQKMYRHKSLHQLYVKLRTLNNTMKQYDLNYGKRTQHTHYQLNQLQSELIINMNV